MKQYIAKIRNRKDLSESEIEKVMHSIMEGKASPEDIRDFLLSLNEKGFSIAEITGAAKTLRQFCIPIKTNHTVLLDTCGTGGDKKGTFNISTVTAFVVAGAGVVVAKHGNRSVSSRCGSADILEALGVNIAMEVERLEECLKNVRLAFLFAQKLHPAMKNVASIRKELGVETIFNILGPLSNPARATHQIIGVYRHDLVELMIHVLKNLGLKRALVVHGSDGLDEITTTGKTFAGEFDGRKIHFYDIDPEQLGMKRVMIKDLKGGDLKTNVEIVHGILAGKKGAKRDIVILNAAYALYVAEKVKNIPDGIKLAIESIDSGKASAKLEKLKRFTQKKD